MQTLGLRLCLDAEQNIRLGGTPGPGMRPGRVFPCAYIRSPYDAAHRCANVGHPRPSDGLLEEARRGARQGAGGAGRAGDRQVRAAGLRQAPRGIDDGAVRGAACRPNPTWRFAGLHELLRPVLSYLGELPEAQSRALAAALGWRRPCMPISCSSRRHAPRDVRLSRKNGGHHRPQTQRIRINTGRARATTSRGSAKARPGIRRRSSAGPQGSRLTWDNAIACTW